jgi:hypothetical protein
MDIEFFCRGGWKELGTSSRQLHASFAVRSPELDVFIQVKYIVFLDQQGQHQKYEESNAIQDQGNRRMNSDRFPHMSKQERHWNHSEKCSDHECPCLDIGKSSAVTYQIKREKREQSGKEHEQDQVLFLAILCEARDFPDDLHDEGDPERPGYEKTGNRPQHSPDNAVEASPKGAKQHPGSNRQGDIRDLTDDDGYRKKNNVGKGSETSESGYELFDPFHREIVENISPPEKIQTDTYQQDGDSGSDFLHRRPPRFPCGSASCPPSPYAIPFIRTG